jgi:hypothetical protein
MDEDEGGTSSGRQHTEEADPLSLPGTSSRSRRRIQSKRSRNERKILIIDDFAFFPPDDTVTTNGVNSFTRSHRVVSAAATSTALPAATPANASTSRHYNNRRTAYEDAPQTRQMSHHVDHNYGEISRTMSVATTSAPPITRRILSRHQRNADELDQLDDERQNNPLSNRLRNRNHSITSTSTSSTPVTLPPAATTPESSFRRIQPSRHQMSSRSNRSEEEPEINIYHRRGSRSATQQQIAQQPTTTEEATEEDEEESTEETAASSSDDSDEMPLSQHVASASPQKNTRQRGGLRTNRNYVDSDDNHVREG